MNPLIPNSTAAARRNGQPYLIGDALSIYGLQQEFQAEARLHFYDGQPFWRAITHRDHVAAANLSLYLEARAFKKPLDRRVKSSLGHAAQRATFGRVVATTYLPPWNFEVAAACPSKADAELPYMPRAE